MKYLYLIFIITFLSSCSSFLESFSKINDQSIVIKTPYVKDADCFFYDGNGRKWRLRKTPGVISVYKGYPPLTVNCHKKGFKNTVLQLYDDKPYRSKSEADKVIDNVFTSILDIIPSIAKGLASIIYDPFVNISKEYPREITVWMEPEKWPSEDFKRVWSYNKSLLENKNIKQKESIDKKRIQEYYEKKIKETN